MKTYDRDKAIKAVGGSQFDLVLMASTRARELRRGSTPKVESANREGITALIEVQEGLYTKQDYLDNLAGKKSKEQIEKEEANDQSF